MKFLNMGNDWVQTAFGAISFSCQIGQLHKTTNCERDRNRLVTFRNLVLHEKTSDEDSTIELDQTCLVGGNMDGNDGDFPTTF